LHIDSGLVFCMNVTTQLVYILLHL
jgi:hypothetical protein